MSTNPQRHKTVLITGISGLIGSRLKTFFEARGYTIRGLSRQPQGEGMFGWDPGTGDVDPAALEGADAVVHLAGENIASGRWTRRRRERILRSRIEGTRCLVQAMRAMQQPPAVFISASGVNIYRADGTEADELGPEGVGFLAGVCRDWEAEAKRAEALGCRVVLMRTGVVLDPHGGALAKMLPAFRLGLGGPVGSGRQAFPWIAMEDLLAIYERAITDALLSGPVNAVAPGLVSQKGFASILAGLLRRPAVAPLPAMAVNLLFGQMGRETLLADLRVRPGKLLAAGHPFRFPKLSPALASMLGIAHFACESESPQ